MEVASSIRDPLQPAFADAFVEAMAEGLDRLLGQGIGRDLREGASRVVRSSNVEREHGLVEVLQNADDLGASELRFQFCDDGRGLRVSHNGDRVEAPHVLAMTLALITTKTDDEAATGKFGVGLKTLSRMAESFAVHSWPYAFEIRNQSLAPADRISAVDSVYDPERPDTLLVLRLHKNYPASALERWFDGLESTALLFLRSVRRLVLLDQEGNEEAVRGLVATGQRRLDLQIDGALRQVEELTLEDTARKQSWTRVSVLEQVPPHLARTDKKTPRRTPLAVAFPDTPTPGRLYAGLPLAIRATLPFSVNAQFDTETARTRLLQDEHWNEWLLTRVGELVAGASRRYLESETPVGWARIPLLDEVEAVEDSWLREQLVGLVSHVHQALSENAELPIDSGTKLEELSYETVVLDGLLSEDDLRALAPAAEPLPGLLRDQVGRWREVLSALKLGKLVQLHDAVEMFSWDDDDLGDRGGDWFVRLLAASVEEGTDWGLTDERCLLEANGARLSPSSALAQGLVLAQSAGDSLVSRLGLQRPLAAAFYSDTDAAKSVMRWLTQVLQVRVESSRQDTLRALARRSWDDPLQLGDDAVLELFRAFQASPELAREVGREIGERILLDGRRRERRRGRPESVRPARAYLPQTSWARAAKATPGLYWLNRRYYRLLRDGDVGAEDPSESKQQAISLFLRSLGAELAPRLEPQPTNKELFGERATLVRRNQLPDTQQTALDSDLYFDALMGDYSSPDLQAVLDDIAKDRVPEARKRAHQLINAMERAWRDLYAGREDAEAVNAYYQMKRKGKIPATWRALAAETPWMVNENGQRRQPRQLAIKTPAFLAFLGQAPSKYAFGLEARHASIPVIRALGFETQPLAATLLARLEELQAAERSGRRIDTAAVDACYVALAELSPDPHARGRNRRMGGETVNGVKARFTRGRLVRAGTTWSAPRNVFVGRPIFHRHARFVPEAAERLWTLLGIRRPTVGDCINVLRRLAQLGSPDGEQPVLIETYRYLNERLSAGEQGPRTLAALPLWTGKEWRSDRPVYAVRDRTLEERLGEHVSVWHPPLPIGTIPELTSALRVTVLDESSFTALGINSGSRAAGSASDRFTRAILKHLRDWLAIHDGDLYERVNTQLRWRRLERVKVALNGRLQVGVAIPGYARVMLPRRAHLQVEPELVLAITDTTALEDPSLMAGLLGSAVGAEESHWHVLAHGWGEALTLTKRDERSSGLRLSDSEPEGHEPASAPGISGVGRDADPTALRRTERHAEHVAATGDGDRPETREREEEVVRPLKQVEDINATVIVVTASADASTPPPLAPDGAPTGLREPRRGKRIEVGDGRGARRRRSDPDRESLGLRVVAKEARELWGVTLRDIRAEHGVGADAIDDAERYYELKAHSREIPAEVSLEPSEFERARVEGENFVLCVVGGLEEGHETVVQLTADPLRHLPWWSNAAIKVGGVQVRPEAEPAGAPAGSAT